MAGDFVRRTAIDAHGVLGLYAVSVSSTRNASSGVAPGVGAYVVVGNEDAERAVARVASVGDDGVVLVAVLPGPVDAHRDLLRDQRATT